MILLKEPKLLEKNVPNNNLTFYRDFLPCFFYRGQGVGPSFTIFLENSTLPETNSSPLKINISNISKIFGLPFLRFACWVVGVKRPNIFSQMVVVFHGDENSMGSNP